MSPKKQAICRVLWILLPPVLVTVILLSVPLLTWIGNALPACTIRRFTGLLCPGCGNTHAVLSLLQGDLLSSFRYNPIPLTGVLVAVAFYLEVAFRLFGKRLRLLPRSFWFWGTLLGLFLTFFVARNFIPALSPF